MRVKEADMEVEDRKRQKEAFAPNASIGPRPGRSGTGRKCSHSPKRWEESIGGLMASIWSSQLGTVNLDSQGNASGTVNSRSLRALNLRPQ